jgi:hypothetical protein
MAKMRTGRKNGGPGDPPKKTNADREIVSLPIRRPTSISNRDLIERQYGKDAYKYTMSGEDDGTVAVSGYKAKTPGFENKYSLDVDPKGKYGKKNFRMSREEIDAISARNRARLEEQQAYDKKRREIISEDERAQRGYAQRKAKQAMQMKQYDAGIAAGLHDVTDLANRYKPGSKLEGTATGAQLYEGRFLSPSEEKKWVDIQKKGDKNYKRLPGSRIVASDPEWIPYYFAEPGEEKRRLEKETYESELAKAEKGGYKIQEDRGMYGPREAYMFVEGVSKPDPFTEEKPERLDIPEERGDEYYGYEPEPQIEKTKQFELSPRPKQKEEERPEWQEPSKPRSYGKAFKGAVMKDKRSRQAARKQRVQSIKDTLTGKGRASYKKEGEMAKAYFGDQDFDSYEGEGTTAIGEDIAMYKDMIKNPSEISGESRAERKERIGAYKSGLKKAKLAKKYLEKAGQEAGFDFSRSDSYNELEGRGIRTYTPQAMKGFREQESYDAMMDESYTGPMSSNLRATRKKK